MAGKKPKAHDIVLLHGCTEDGEGIRALRSRPSRIELAELRKVKEGKPIHGELVQLRSRKESPLLFDVEVAHSPEKSEADAAAHDGPPRVASSAYRSNWDAVFGKKPKHELPN